MHTKILIRTDSFIEHYQHWLQNDVKDAIEMLSGSYANEVFGKGSDDLKYEQSPACKRITWHTELLSHQKIGFLIDLFKTKLVAFAGYRLTLSDDRMEVFDNGLRLIRHRHYVKPERTPVLSFSDCQDGKFGNLVLEHMFNKDKNILCVSATYCHDLQYTSFEKLMEFLLS